MDTCIFVKSPSYTVCYIVESMQLKEIEIRMCQEKNAQSVENAVPAVSVVSVFYVVVVVVIIVVVVVVVVVIVACCCCCCCCCRCCC